LNATKIQDWLIAHVGELLHIAPGTIYIHDSLSNYGLTSRDAVALSGELEEWLGRRLSPTLAYEYPSIWLLSQHLAGPPEKKKPSTPVNSSKADLIEPIAVIGMGCRFPGAKDPESFWQLLRDGVDVIREIPADRWEKNDYYHRDATVAGKSISNWGGFLDSFDQFDPFFFGISPMEAKYMDPQQRLLLELSYEALDDAGQTREDYDGSKTGVFIGISINEYSHLQFADPSLITSHSGTGSALSIAANRISYFYNFHGPSMAIDTACSSSLAAVHLACQSLRSGECTMALSGGVNIILSPVHSIAFTKAGVLAPDGRCKAFDARANGYVRGEGGGVIVLKTLSSALADGNPVHAVILGSAMCQDGRTNGLMAPSAESQEAMLRQAYHSAGICPGSVQYIETHGTGTLLGDSIEAKAIGAVIGQNRINGPCAIGSVKTNIGHLEAAAGIAGLIKVILSLKHRTILPSLHYQSPNPYIRFDELGIRVQDHLAWWPLGTETALAGVSSFGFGGTNVHVVVGEAEKSEEEETNKEWVDSVHSDWHILPLSANNPEMLKMLAGSFAEFLRSASSVTIKDICRAAGLRRSQYDYRLSVIGYSKKDLCSSLENFLREEPDPDLFIGDMIPNRPTRLAFVFSGQGGQWYNMGRELLKKEPVFYQAMQQIDQIVRANFGWSLMNSFDSEQSTSQLSDIDLIQPMLFSIQVALASLWASWGIKPDAVIGHSMGEVAAAYVAGILTLEDAVQIICRRSQLLKQLPGLGSMMVTELSTADAKALIKDHGEKISIAAINSPSSTVLSGEPEAMKKIMDILQGRNLFCKLVNVDVASHSPQVEPVRSELLKALQGINPQPSKLPFYSTVTGSREDGLILNAEYWMDNLRKPVLFADAIGQLLDDGHTVFIEIGPHPLLLGSIQQSLEIRHIKARLIASLNREQPDREVLLRALGTLYIDGFSIAWNKVYGTTTRHVNLPPVLWQRQSYRIDSNNPGTKSSGPLAAGKIAHPLLGDRINLANSPSSFVWQNTLDNEILQFLGDHRIENESVFPAAGYIEMALQARKESGLNKSHELADFIFIKKMILETGKPPLLQALLLAGEDGHFLFSVYSRTDAEDWVLHATATFQKNEVVNNHGSSIFTSPDIIRKQSSSQLNTEEFYKLTRLHGLEYGPGFRAVQHVWSNDEESLGRIVLPVLPENDLDSYQVHPALLDACLQVLSATHVASTQHDLYIPAGCRHIRFFRQPLRVMWSHVSLEAQPSTHTDVLTANIRLLDEDDQIVAELVGLRLQRTSKSLRNLSAQDTWFYQVRWKSQRALTASVTASTEKRNWLILADDEGLGEQLARLLEAAGDTCYFFSYKETIENLESTTDEAFTDLIETLLKQVPLRLYGVIHLWSLSIPPWSPGLSETRDLMAWQGCNGVLFLVQALNRRVTGSTRLWLVTRGAQFVKPGEPVVLEQSALWGLGKVISFEFPELNCTRIDVDPGQSNVQNAAQLLTQVTTNDQEDQIALRAGVRFVLRLLPFISTTISRATKASFHADGTYLVTGGLGGLGLSIAKWMSSKGARHLALLGRSEPSASALTIIDQLRHEGTEVIIIRADVSNATGLKEALEKITETMPVIRGVIHAAAVLDDGSLLSLNTDRMKRVMAPKVDGTFNIHHATLGLPLEFFALFSSAVSLLGSPGQGNYAAASSYLDAMAYHRRNLGLPAISINWGPWDEVGLAAEAIERLKGQNGSIQHLIKVIKIDRGLEILEQVLTEATTQVMVLPFDLKNLVELYPAAAGMPFLSEIGSDNSIVARLYARPKLQQEYIAPRNEIEQKLAELWRQTLHIDRVGVHDSFFQLGGDSVLGAQILALAQKKFGIRINPQDAFKAFTIERLGEMLTAEILSKIEDMSEDEVRQHLSKPN
jgi:acyl transferase domain-containing protein/acyl carrier protein